MRRPYSEIEFAKLFKTLTVDQKRDFISAYDQIIQPCVVANESQKNDMAMYLLKRILGMPCSRPRFQTARKVRSRKERATFERRKHEMLEKLQCP